MCLTLVKSQKTLFNAVLNKQINVQTKLVNPKLIEIHRSKQRVITFGNTLLSLEKLDFNNMPRER